MRFTFPLWEGNSQESAAGGWAVDASTGPLPNESSNENKVEQDRRLKCRGEEDPTKHEGLQGQLLLTVKRDRATVASHCA